MAVRIILADEQKLFQEGLIELFHKTPDYQVLAAVDNGIDLYEKTLELKPDLVVMDLLLKKQNGSEAARKIVKVMSFVKIIVLTPLNDRVTVTMAFRSGIHGYLLKICPFEELQKAIKTVFSNHCYLTTEIMDVFLDNLLNPQNKAPITSFHELTVREREVLQMVSEGNTIKQIAALLNISGKTVSTYRERVMKKLNLCNNVDLARFAIREGLTRL